MAVWEDYEKGRLGTTAGATLLTVPTGKKWSLMDIVLFNAHASSAREVHLYLGGDSAGDKIFERDLKSHETYAFVLTQKLPAGTTVRGHSNGY